MLTSTTPRLTTAGEFEIGRLPVPTTKPPPWMTTRTGRSSASWGALTLR